MTNGVLPDFGRHAELPPRDRGHLRDAIKKLAARTGEAEASC
ncbi:hypothetical protein MPC4_120065 [Methylocella tundrae]|uniref:Uncharacterized protein n=1 Tax=Methylocella tundrae TaxID=227605 RepID=A0A4V6IME1_METTU|nr:protein of unknown function [Methylocella tundrae]VTZ48940.1 hypothetical protein MPC4_120065 [Methylocella tundrae]